MKKALIFILICTIIACEKKEFNNEAVVSSKQNSTPKTPSTLEDFSPSRRVQKIVNLFENGQLSENESARLILSAHQELSHRDEFNYTAKLISKSSIKLESLLNEILGKENGNNKFEKLMTELVDSQASNLQVELILRQMGLRQVKLNNQLISSIFKLTDRNGVNDDLLKDEYLTLIFSTAIDHLVQSDEASNFKFSDKTLMTIANHLENQVAKINFESNAVGNVSNVYDLFDSYFAKNLKSFNDSSRAIFSKWQTQIDYKLYEILQNKTFDQETINKLNPHLQLFLGKKDILSIYKMKGILESTFFYKYISLKSFRYTFRGENQIVFLKKKNSLIELLKEFYNKKKYTFDLTSFSSGRNTKLLPGIYTLPYNSHFHSDKLVFSPLSVIMSESSRLEFTVNKMHLPWIDVSGHSSSLNPEEKNPYSGISPKQDYFHEPSPAYGSKYVIRGLKEHHTVPVDFSTCQFDGTDPGWSCITRMIFRYDEGKVPQQQRHGADGEDGGIIKINSLRSLSAAGIFVSNGGTGSEGHRGDNSPLCNTQGGSTNYSPFSNIQHHQYFTCISKTGCDQKEKGINPLLKPYFSHAEKTEPQLNQEIPLVHVSRGRSGNGGNGGNGGEIIMTNSLKSQDLVLLVLPGLPGKSGKIASCGPEHDLDQQPISNIQGISGMPGKKGEVTY